MQGCGLKICGLDRIASPNIINLNQHHLRGIHKQQLAILCFPEVGVVDRAPRRTYLCNVQRMYLSSPRRLCPFLFPVYKIIEVSLHRPNTPCSAGEIQQNVCGSQRYSPRAHKNFGRVHEFINTKFAQLHPGSVHFFFFFYPLF